jgi:dephospho-CoA kinase
MREKAFADASVKNQLEAILHPLISAECSKQASTFAESIVVFDVPLLVESRKWRSQIDKVLVMDCDNDVQLHRVMQRPGWTRDSALAVIAQQAPRDIRVAAADAVIINHQLTLPQLADEVNALWARWAISR